MTASHQSQLEKPKYRNWVQAGLGLLYVKEGLEPFCDDIVQQQHTDIINRVQQTPSLATVTCGQCNLRTLKPNHVRVQNRQCPLRQVKCNCLNPVGKIPCPNNICGAIYDEIVNLHASTPPAPCWKNTDAQFWCTDPWSIARCFINAPGYADKLSASDTDCTGLLHVLINNKDLHINHIQCQITGTDVFSKVRKYRNTIYHSSSMELEDSDVSSILDIMIAVLQDGKELNNRTEAQAAVQKLTELKEEDFIITIKNEVQVLEVAMKTLSQNGKEISDKIDDAKLHLESKQNEISDILSQVEREIRSKGKEEKDTLDISGLEIKKELETKCTEASDKLHQERVNIEDELQRRLTEIKTEIEMKKKDALDEIETRTSSSVAEINESRTKRRKVDKNITRIENLDIDHISTRLAKLEAEMEEQKKQTNEELSSLRIELKDNNAKKFIGEDQLDYTKKKADFQTRLMELYEETVVMVPALPLKPRGNMKDIGAVYFKPWLEVETRQSGKDSSQSNRSTKYQISIDEIFCNTDKRASLIYVLGEAGTGKSAFCIYLIRQWCNAHASRIGNESASEIGNKLKTFEFLFYITLRHNIGCDDIRSMLHQQYGDPILDRILENESNKCLILLDGLDEWYQNKQVSQFQTKGLPTRDHSKQYTVLTTSRPWKFETLRIKDTEVHKRVTLKGLNRRSQEEMETKFIDMLNHMFHKNKQHEDFKVKFNKNPAFEINYIPIIHQQLICLWFDEKLHGTSVCATYSSMLELLLDWTELKTKEDEELAKVKDLSQNQNIQLPEYLSTSDTCNDFKYVISCLSLLAFETLFSVKRENSLSFTRSIFQHLKIPMNIKGCFLKTGILTEDRCVTLNASCRQQSSFSFLHKTIQEYLAAVYIAIQFEAMTEVRFQDKCKECVEKYFTSCKTVDDIVHQSNVFIMICGLKPQLLTSISEYINNIIISDTTHTNFDDELQILTMATDYFWCSSIGYPRERYRSYVTGVQKCISRCADEVATTGKQRHQRIHLAKIFVAEGYDISRICEQAIIPQSIRTLHSDSRKFIKLLHQMTHLTSLDITDITMSGEECSEFSLFLTQSTQLENIVVAIQCTDHEEHRLDLSKHDKIECIEYSICGFCVHNLARSSLDSDKVLRSRAKIIMKMSNPFGKYKVKCIHLNYHSLECQYLNEAGNRTHSLVMLLPPVMSLNYLAIGGLILIDPVFAHPLDMISLETIVLEGTIMTETTWCNFIDSLPAFPNNVLVKTANLEIKMNGEYDMSSKTENSKENNEKDVSSDDETNDISIVDEVKGNSADNEVQGDLTDDKIKGDCTGDVVNDDSIDDEVKDDSKDDEVCYDRKSETDSESNDDSTDYAAANFYEEAKLYVTERPELFRVTEDVYFTFIHKGNQ